MAGLKDVVDLELIRDDLATVHQALEAASFPVRISQRPRLASVTSRPPLGLSVVMRLLMVRFTPS